MRLIILSALLLTTSIGYPFGDAAHRAIATAAEERLSESTKARIRQILGSEKMADAAIWPDRLQESKAPDAVAFCVLMILSTRSTDLSPCWKDSPRP
jgi:hypothetical protein